MSLSTTSNSKSNVTTAYTRDVTKTAEQLAEEQRKNLSSQPYVYSITTNWGETIPLGTTVGLNDSKELSKRLEEIDKKLNHNSDLYKRSSTLKLNWVNPGGSINDNTSRWINYARTINNNMRPLSHLTLLDTKETSNQLGQTIENLNNKAASNLNNNSSNSSNIGNPQLKLNLGNSEFFTQNPIGDIVAKEINLFNAGSKKFTAAIDPKTGKPTSWSKFKAGAQNVMNNKYTKMGMQALDFAMNFMGDNDKDINSWDATTKQLRGGIENSLVSSGNPWLMAAGLASKGLGKLGMFGDASSGLGTANDIANTLGSFIPGVGWLSKKTKEIQKYQDVMASTGFTGLINDVNKAAQNAGGRFLFGTETANLRTGKAEAGQIAASNVLDTNKLALNSSSNPLFSNRSQMLLSGGYNVMNSKNGAKLYNLQEAKRILSNRLQSFKQGGAVNVIPDGALHKNRHHLEDIDEKFEDVTTKGIPVITEAKNGDIIQQAEVEKEEIIFNLEVTKKLEELMEKGTDEAAIEAGKLLTEEILRNTIDNTKKLL